MSYLFLHRGVSGWCWCLFAWNMLLVLVYHAFCGAVSLAFKDFRDHAYITCSDAQNKHGLFLLAAFAVRNPPATTLVVLSLLRMGLLFVSFFILLFSCTYNHYYTVHYNVFMHLLSGATGCSVSLDSPWTWSAVVFPDPSHRLPAPRGSDQSSELDWVPAPDTA